MLDIIRNLRATAEKLATGQVPDPTLCAWLGRSLVAFLDHQATTLEEAIGIQRCKGGMPWWKEEAVRKRNHALLKIAGMIAPGASVAEQARKVQQAVARYGTGRWRIDRQGAAMPAGYVGTVEQWLWLAHASGAPLPLGLRQLRSILNCPMSIGLPAPDRSIIKK